MPQESEQDKLPYLEGITVLDMTRYVSGPYCTMLLADNGANVIKVEPLDGEDTRHIDPMFTGPGGDTVSAYFVRFNRNKSSVCLDLKTDMGARVFRRLLESADVLVENFRPGVLERLGFGAVDISRINPKLIYCSISGYGHDDGPYRDRPAFAPTVEGLAGVVRYNPPDGNPPLTMGLSLGDFFPGALAFGAIGLALLQRQSSGVGNRIDMSMYDTMVSLNERAVTFSTMLGQDCQPGAPSLRSTPSGIYRAADGYITISVVGERIWDRFCRAIEREDLLQDERLSSGPKRAEAFDQVLKPAMDAWLLARTRDQAVKELLANGVPAGEVMRPDEVVASQLTASRGMVVQYPTYAGVNATVSATPFQFGDRKAQRLEPAPAPGEHTETVLRDVARFSEAEIEDLLINGIVRQWRSGN